MADICGAHVCGLVNPELFHVGTRAMGAERSPQGPSVRAPSRTRGPVFGEHRPYCLRYRHTDPAAFFFVSFHVDVFVLTHVIWAILSRLDSSDQQSDVLSDTAGTANIPPRLVFGRRPALVFVYFKYKATISGLISRLAGLSSNNNQLQHHLSSPVNTGQLCPARPYL